MGGPNKGKVMRTFIMLFALAIAGVFAMPQSASAGYPNDYICFKRTDGSPVCRALSNNWRLPGVPKVRCRGKYNCPRPTVTITLTHAMIRCLMPYTNTSGMAPRHRATIYARK